ncbi:hypothetical protein [Oscillibacter sp.]|uniref:hypothetical protein n=1 Tax=Oscillibacter sp. TaxID=1945593 RepID=UPI00289B58CE|nr:hypothetical protein [Oscillibacter sp.]
MTKEAKPMSALKPCELAHIFERSRLISDNFTEEAVTAACVAALGALRAQPANEPLTPEELRERRGERMWVETMQEWRMVYIVVEKDVRLYSSLNTISAKHVLYNEGRVYRRKPEEEKGNRPG